MIDEHVIGRVARLTLLISLNGMKMKKLIQILFSGFLLVSGAVEAHAYKAGDIEIDHPYIRATPPGAAVAGGFMTITNHGKEADRLLGGSVEFAQKVEVHTMEMDGDVMKMMKLSDGLEIPAGGSVVLKPGGFHVMFIKLNGQLKEGEKRQGILVFEKAGEIKVDFAVEKTQSSGHGHH